MLKLTGVVIKGKQKGFKIGFPTANLVVKEDIPKGIYAGEVFWHEKRFKAAIFIGERYILEAHLLDFSGNLYGEKIEVFLGKKIRNRMNFGNDEELKEQIKKDIKLIRSI